MTAAVCVGLLSPALVLGQMPEHAVQIAALALPEAPQPQSVPQASSSSSTKPPEPSAKAPVASQPDAAQTDEEQRAQAERDLKTEEKQRLLGIMPQFQTVVGGKAVRLTSREKWQLASHTAIDPFYIGYAFVIGGGYSELVGSHPGYGWGPGGYFKRVGANYADNIDGALIGNGLLPILLHQDPRYFRQGTGSFGSRFLHAALSTVICHGDNGHLQANVSNVLGNFISGAISNAYYPANERGTSLTIENGLQVTALGAVGGQLLEFGPDINHLFHRHKGGSSGPVSGAGASQP